MDEEKRQENPQGEATGVSETIEPMGSESMSAESNLPNSSEGTPEEMTMAQDAEAPAEFTLEPDAEPFDLTPEAAPSAEPSSEGQTAEVQSQLDELNQRIESLKAQLEDRNGQYMRLAADFENYRKRTQKEKEDQEQVVKCSTIKELLPVVDNFERARSQLKPQTDGEMNLHKSYQGVYKDLVDRLKKIGVAPMRAEGEVFDPSLHEAVMREETDQYPEGTVIEELRRGYVLGDLVLRHAMVKVATALESDGSSQADASS
ncbi:MAG: nucleotide exchange factor GrpE [Elainellaceae cyanobacterium]